MDNPADTSGSATAIPFGGNTSQMRVNHKHLKNPKCKNTREVTSLSVQMHVIHTHACTLEGIAQRKSCT